MTLPYSENDIFRGFAEEDVVRIQGLKAEGLTVDPAVYTDALGVKTPPTSCFWIGPHIGSLDTEIALTQHPLGQDAIELASLALALEFAKGRDRFTVGEIGAGWGPWTSAASVVARRLFSKVDIIAMEADPQRFVMLRKHLDANALVPIDAPDIGASDTGRWSLYRAAAGTEDGTLYWPANTEQIDAGAAATSDPTETIDYRGASIQTVAVQALSLATVLKDVERVDFLHVDIQGAEADVIPAGMAALNQCVKAMFIGTHSRKIEGDFIHSLREEGWILLREKPCQFYPSAQAPSLTGLTYTDGGQLWVNPKI